MGNLKGSFTIEAAVVVPVTMVIMVAVVFLAFFAYDKATMTAVCDYGLMETAGKMKNSQGTVQSGISELLNARLLAASDISVSAGGDAGSSYISSSAHFNIPLLMIRTLLGDESLSFSVNMDVSNLDGRGKLLLYKSIMDGVSTLTENMME